MKTIVIISGKGGTGKTSVTAALSGLGPKKVIADCDVDAADLHLVLKPQTTTAHDFYQGETASIDPTVCTQCGQCREHCRFGAISDDFAVREEHCEGCGVCAFVCPVQAATMAPAHCGWWYTSETRFGPMVHAALKIGAENSGKLVTTVRTEGDAIAEQIGAELVLVDGSPGVGCPVIASLTGADLALIVTEPTTAAKHDFERVLELTHHFKIPAATVINKTGINPDVEKELENLCAKQDIVLAGRLPYDTAVADAQIHGRTICEHDPDGLGKNIQAIWNTLEKQL
ncbi:MAG: ATP-binding protein [Desulfovibrio sp.]|uniref:ATP-binding protein n=1 Tax=Desulfovibrio sp. 7SRBS1 TaxID=3378064 RepID=UPI003B40556E